MEAIQSLTGSPLDVLIIGGGIVGAGVARDAAMRGMRVGLVEQRDFAFGTSSRSSRLLHGGVRYLAQGRLGLVRQASLEKGILHQIAPHLAEPRAFIFPAYRSTPWPLWQLRIGVRLYDLLCSGKNFGKSRSLARAEVLKRLPGLNRKDLTGAVRYYDGFTNDARLVVDSLRSAAKNGAIILNYARFIDAARKPDGWTCEIRDSETGLAHGVRSHAIINATGPWAGKLPHSQVKLRLTKGIRIVIERERLGGAASSVSGFEPEAVAITEGKRLLFVLPWGERTIIGTTDTDYAGSLENVRAEATDIVYLLRVANEFFPGAQLVPSDIISTWAGVRPLIADPHGNPSDISRSHQIRTPEPGWWDVAGGKLTTYRLMAEETVDEIISWLKQRNGLNGNYSPCRTARDPLLPSDETDGISSILPSEFCQEAVEHFCRKEWALHLEDVMVRRSGWHAWFGNAEGKAEQVADWMAELLGWTPEVRSAELRNYLSSVAEMPVEHTAMAR